MAMCQSRIVGVLKNTKFSYWLRGSVRHKRTYVVLLPETPTDSMETNALLQTDRLANFSEIQPITEKCFTGVGKIAMDYESGVFEIENAALAKEPQTFKNVIEKLDKLEAPLTKVWGTVRTLYMTKQNEIDAAIFEKIQDRVQRARCRKFLSQPIYEACKTINAKECTTLDEVQQRVMQKFLLEGRLNGMELSKVKLEILNDVLNKMETHKNRMEKKMKESVNRFSERIRDPSIVANFPEDLLKYMAQDINRYKEGPWHVTLHPYIYHSFMRYCPVQELRWNCWQAYNMQASGHLDTEVNASIDIEEIRDCRNRQAELLGYENFAEMSMETKMAGTTENVMTTINNLRKGAKELQDAEISSLQKFAESCDFKGPLQAHDIPYWRQKQKEIVFGHTDLQLMQYFPFEHVFTELLQLTSMLFDVTFEEVLDGSISTWHPDVRFFNIFEGEAGGGKYLSSFYLDPYKRPDQKLYTPMDPAFVIGCCNRSEVSGTSPVVSLIFNFPAPLSDHEDVLLTFSDVNILFGKFGFALQYLLTSAPYSEVAGHTNLEWDATEVCSNFLQNWLYEPTVLAHVGRHPITGGPLTDPLLSQVIASHYHMAGYDMCTELYLSHLDLRLYSSEDFWLDIVRELWPLYWSFKLLKKDHHTCSFTAIFTEAWAAGYYSHIWSRMVAADAFQAFCEETGDFSRTGKRFRDTFLALGGGCHSSEVFRRFRGRDPSPEALLKMCKLSK